MPETTLSLLCHPVGQCAAVTAIDVSFRSTDQGELALSYQLSGDLAGLRLPAPATAGPADGLWQHTCCEAFVATVDGSEYREFNFSPSGQWAAYRFTDYRQRDEDFVATGAPKLSFHLLADGFRLDALLPAALLPPGRRWRIGLTAVVEAADGDKTYWALAHAAPQPDFHRRPSFTLILSA